MEKEKGRKQGKNSKRRFRITRFWGVYFTVTAMAFLLVAVSQQIVKSRLAEYEAVQPKYLAAEVFDSYFRPIRYEKLLADARYDAGEVQDQEIAEYLKKEIGDSELTYSVGSSNVPGETRYLVKAGEKQLASIILRVSERKTRHGFDTYEFSYLELHLNTETAAERAPVIVEAPASCLVTVDGKPAAAEFPAVRYNKTDALKYYPPDITGVEYVAYTLEDLETPHPEIVVTDAQGQQAEVVFDEETNTYTAGVVYSRELEEEYSDFVTEAMEGYAEYIQASQNKGLGSIKPYFDTDSEAYAEVVAAGGSRWMVKEWDSVDFENVEVGEFYAHTPESFSCHISFTQVLHRNGREDYVDVVDKYVFLHMTENGYRIFAWHNV